MKNGLIKRALIPGVFATSILLSFAVSAAGTSFAMVYSGNTESGGSCGSTYNIAGVEPSTAGTYPVYIYMVGTTENYNNAAAMATVNAMASKGYVAAAIQYANLTAPSTCSVLASKASCIFDANSPASAVSQICSRTKADCSKGIVVGGFSQGSLLSVLAKNYDSRVQAAYALGLSNKYTSMYDFSSCVGNGKRTLQSDRLRAVDGESDELIGDEQAGLQSVTGYTCPTGSASCLSSNNSGWIIVKNSQVSDLSADHCYMRSWTCAGGNTLDPNWKSGTQNWAMEPNLQWLTNFTTK
jgi:hypothetical protein